jgi:large subunit ribosomal protein L5
MTDGQDKPIDERAEATPSAEPEPVIAQEQAPVEPAAAEAPGAAAESAAKPAPEEAKPKAKAKGKRPEGEAAAKPKGKGKKAAEPEAPPVPQRPRVPPRLKVRYFDEMMPAMMKQFGYRNTFQAPRLQKVVLNMGVGSALQDPKTLENAAQEMAIIAGQRPTITRAKKSIAAFKLRAKMAIGCRVTLRGDRMYEFLDRLLNVALPRIRDFRGVPTRSVDGRGNYTLGLREQTIFPEIDLEKVDRVRGMDVTIVTSARSDEEARVLLTLMGMPFQS